MSHIGKGRERMCFTRGAARQDCAAVVAAGQGVQTRHFPRDLSEERIFLHRQAASFQNGVFAPFPFVVVDGFANDFRCTFDITNIDRDERNALSQHRFFVRYHLHLKISYSNTNEQ